MFNKNVFTQKDPIADLIKGINEADYKAKMEALKGNQHKIDKNKNNKVDADDFKILRGEKKVNEDQVEEAAESPFTSWKKPRQPEPSGGSGVKQGSRYGGSKQKDKPEHDDEKTKKEEIDPKKVTTDTLAGQVKGKTSNPFAPKKVMMDVAGNVKEEAEQVEAKALIENYEIINEVSVGAKIRAYAQHSSDAFDHYDMGNSDEGEHHENRADKILAHIEKHHGAEAVKHAQKAAHSATFGRGGHSRGSDSLSGGLRGALQKTITKAGKIPKNTQSAVVNQRKTYGSRVTGPKGHLPEEVEHVDEASSKTVPTMANAPKMVRDRKTGQMYDPNKKFKELMDKPETKAMLDRLAKEDVEQVDERELSKGETAEKERIVKGMKKSLAGFKARYGDKAKSVMYATATKAAKKD
jgi:hypothetical protein